MSKIKIPKTELINKSFLSHYLFFMEPILGLRIQGQRLDTLLNKLSIYLFKPSYTLKKDEIGLGQDFFIYKRRINKVFAVKITEQITKSDIDQNSFVETLKAITENFDCFIYYSIRKNELTDYEHLLLKLEASAMKIKGDLQDYATKKTGDIKKFLDQTIQNYPVYSRECFILVSEPYDERKAEECYTNISSQFHKLSLMFDFKSITASELTDEELHNFTLKHLAQYA
jgi:hypothetical protein